MRTRSSWAKYWTVMNQFPVWGPALLIFKLLLNRERFKAAALSGVVVWLFITVCVTQFRGGRSFFARYIRLLCTCGTRTTVGLVCSCKDLKDFEKRGLDEFEKVKHSLEMLKGSLFSGLLNAAGFVVAFLFPFWVILSPAIDLSGISGLSEIRKLELSAVSGTFLVVTFAQLLLPKLHFKSTKYLGFLLPLIYFMLAVAAAPLIFSGAAELLGRVVPATDNNVMDSVPPEDVIHAAAVFFATVLLLVYDVFALMGLTKPSGGAEESRAELLQMCVVVDFPLMVAAGVAIYYCFTRWTSLGEQAEPLLAGALGMQFIISALLFAVVKQQLATRINVTGSASQAGEKSEVINSCAVARN